VRAKIVVRFVEWPSQNVSGGTSTFHLSSGTLSCLAAAIDSHLRMQSDMAGQEDDELEITPVGPPLLLRSAN
jgi:hypothetical protein